MQGIVQVNFKIGNHRIKCQASIIQVYRKQLNSGDKIFFFGGGGHYNRVPNDFPRLIDERTGVYFFFKLRRSLMNPRKSLIFHKHIPQHL